jgi:hypothetical protein
MTRNQKIAVGCGGAGCLGLIVVAIAGGLIYYFYSASRSTYDRYANINFNSNSNRNVNLNGNANSDDSTNSNSSNSSSAASLSEDDKHKLFQAAAMTGDAELQRRVWVKIGILDEDFSQGDKFAEFAAAHVGWAIRNYQWVGSIDSREKARAYVNENLPQ